MRSLGIAVLGIFAGLIVGFLVFSELIGRLLVAGGSGVHAPWTFVIGLAPWVLAIVGAPAAIAIDNNHVRRAALDARR